MSRRGFFLRGISAAGLSGTSTAVYPAAIEPERLMTTSYRLAPSGWNAGRLMQSAQPIPRLVRDQLLDHRVLNKSSEGPPKADDERAAEAFQPVAAAASG